MLRRDTQNRKSTNERESFAARLVRRELLALEWAVVALVVVFVVLPVGLILLYRVVPPPLTSVMVLRLVEGQSLTREWVPLERIAPSVRYAVIASEDNTFCTHNGVDWTALRQALDAEIDGGGQGGASTITMQTARNLMLWPGRNYIRKALELYIATLIDALWPKERIFEVYLNIAEWGPGVFGIEAAARHHFGVSAKDVTSREAARLAVVLPNPIELHATASTGHVTRQAAVVRKRIGQLGPLLDCVRPQL
ncbi:MAG: monofunctional biosynthetic peptidoglycan transglycosylase [Candidatus Phaeomarinobacter sp.]